LLGEDGVRQKRDIDGVEFSWSSKFTKFGFSLLEPFIVEILFAFFIEDKWVKRDFVVFGYQLKRDTLRSNNYFFLKKIKILVRSYHSI